MSTKSIQRAEVIRETGNVRVTVLRLSPEAKQGLSTGGAGLMHASPEDMDRLLTAARAKDLRVEIRMHAGGVSGSLEAAREQAEWASGLNAKGSRVARILDAEGRRFECGVSAEQARELVAAGAIEK